MKTLIKNAKPLYSLYRYLDRHLRKLLFRISPALASRYLYLIVFGRVLRLRRPQRFSEKLIWLNLRTRNPLWVRCTDKYAVRDYVAERGCAATLNELYGVYDSVSAIDWRTLPQQFVLKCTHGCGCNIICSNKDVLDEEATCKRLELWMHTDYSILLGVKHYREIKPCIVCEKYLGDSDGGLPIDYKIDCFNGVPKVIEVHTERAVSLVCTYRDLNWNFMPIGIKDSAPERNQEQPACLHEMIAVAEKLSRGIPFVRVDLYNLGGRVVFGEMTFVPAGGFDPYLNEEGDCLFGKWLQLRTG
jgi:hypothetical protein